MQSRIDLVTVFLLVLLLSPALSNPTSQNAKLNISTFNHAPNEYTQTTVPANQRQYTLDSGYYFDFKVNALHAGTKLTFQVDASSSLDIYVMTAAQFSNCCSSGRQNNPSLFSWTGLQFGRTVTLPFAGLYYLVMENDISSSPITFTLSYSTVPVDIHHLYSAVPAPVGIADYGIVNSGNLFATYELTASSVTGTASISDISAFNESAIGSSIYGASLQLNVVAQVNTTGGQHEYWLQNVIVLDTSYSVAHMLSNIHNDSSQTAILDSSVVSGRGSVLPSMIGGNYYAMSSSDFHYDLPSAMEMQITVTHSDNIVVIGFGSRNSTWGGGPLSLFDNVSITELDPVLEAAIVVSGYRMTPGGDFFDAEFVFGGDSNGAITGFDRMDATLAMYYTFDDGRTSAPRSVFGFGSDTAEAAYNLETDMVGGEFQVSLGSTNFLTSYILPQSAELTFSYSCSDSSVIPYSPILHYVQNGTEVTIPLGQVPAIFNVDYGSTWTVTTMVEGIDGERWVAVGETKGVTGIDQSFSIPYTHEYYLTVMSTEGGGSVSPSTGWHDAGEFVFLNASAAAGWMFEGWTGSGVESYSGASNSTIIRVDGPMYESGTFYPSLTIDTGFGGSIAYQSGLMNGTVSPGATRIVYFPQGSLVTLKAEPSLLFEFNGWTGTFGSSTDSFQMTLSEPSVLRGNFSINFVLIGVVVVVIAGSAGSLIYFVRRLKVKRPHPRSALEAGSKAGLDPGLSFPTPSISKPVKTAADSDKPLQTDLASSSISRGENPTTTQAEQTAMRVCFRCQDSGGGLAECDRCHRNFCYRHVHPLVHECPEIWK